jgi:hypothetical protein
MPDNQVPVVEYDATIDECVDSILRAYRSTGTSKHVRNTNSLWLGGGLAAAMTFMMAHFGNYSRFAFEVGIPVGLISGTVAALFYGPVQDNMQERNVRRFVKEKLKGPDALRSRTEVRPDCLWMNTVAGDLSIPWERVRRVEETAAGIDIWLEPSNLCALPLRAFDTPSEMQLFANAVKRHISRSGSMH